MGRPINPDLTKYWKVALPATLAGAIEYELVDPLTRKPKYGDRSKLISDLLTRWLAEKHNRPIPLEVIRRLEELNA